MFRGECNLFIPLLLLWRTRVEGIRRGGGIGRGGGGGEEGGEKQTFVSSFNWKTLIRPIFASSL